MIKLFFIILLFFSVLFSQKKDFPITNEDNKPEESNKPDPYISLLNFDLSKGEISCEFITQKKIYYLGESFNGSINCNKGGYLYLFYLSNVGEFSTVTPLLQYRTKLLPSVPLQIPKDLFIGKEIEILIEPPYGADYLFAIVTKEPFYFNSKVDTPDYVLELISQLKSLPVSEWGGRKVCIEIVDEVPSGECE